MSVSFTDTHYFVMSRTTRANGNRRRRGRWLPKPVPDVAGAIKGAMDAIAAAGHRGGVEWKALETEYKRFSQQTP